jgi:hypothetical protein
MLLLLIACLDALKLCKVYIPVDAQLLFLPDHVELSAVALGVAVFANHTERLRLSTCFRRMALWTLSQSQSESHRSRLRCYVRHPMSVSRCRACCLARYRPSVL